MEKRADNYPAMISMEKDIGKRLAQEHFKKNKYSYRLKRETYNTNYVRSSADGKFVQVASVSISSPLPKPGLDLNSLPLTASIEAGVEFRPAFCGALRPKDSRDETMLAACDCTFQMPDSFDDISKRHLVISPHEHGLIMHLDELLSGFFNGTRMFFAQFVYPYPFDQLSLADVVALYETPPNQKPMFKFSGKFDTSAYRLAEAAEEYWKEVNNSAQAELFKHLRRKIWNDPKPFYSALSEKPADQDNG
ncbi:MAG: hypothetical protein JSS83_23225 [Cyanobacteria bacterium SZAS LIN-3]|nr:hypothetical protein [Cyanobacteria bacterium SZAS LIN-3]